MEFPRPEYWSGWPFPSPGDLPNPGIKLESLALQADSLPSELPGKPWYQGRPIRWHNSHQTPCLKEDGKRQITGSILKEISPEYSLEGLMLKLKLQYFGHLIWRTDSLERPWCWEGLGTGGEGDDRGWDGWMASATRWTWVWLNSGSWWCTGRPGVLQFKASQRVGHDWVTELNWTELNTWLIIVLKFPLWNFGYGCM